LRVLSIWVEATPRPQSPGWYDSVGSEARYTCPALDASSVE